MAKKFYKREYLLTLPAIVLVAFVTQGLFLGTIILSFVKWNMIRPDFGVSFAGLSNFVYLFQAKEFYIAVYNTLLIGSFSLFFCFVFGLTLALLLNRKFLGVQVLRSLILIPFFIANVVTGIIFKTLILNPSFGIAGDLATRLGITPLDFMGDHAVFSVIFLIVWQWTPFFVLILLAGLQGLNHELLESAQIDGAKPLLRLFKIILPSILHHIEVAVLLGLVFILKVFGLIYVTTSGGPGNSTSTLPYLVYKTNQFKFEVGETAALAMLTVILTLALLIFIFRFFQRKLS